MSGYYNKFGLMGGSDLDQEKYGINDRSQVLPFSVMSSEYNSLECRYIWFQVGVHETRKEAITAAKKHHAEYGNKCAIGDTNEILNICHPDNNNKNLSWKPKNEDIIE